MEGRGPVLRLTRGVRARSAVGVLRATLSTQRSRRERTGIQREVGAAGGGGAGGLEGGLSICFLYLLSSEVIRDTHTVRHV